MSEDPTSDCCSTPSVSEAPPPPALAARAAADEANPKAGRWAAGGAVVAALASSACCWLPLSLIALGVSAGGIGAFFEAYRFYFLGGTALLLGAGFYYVYLRKPTCAPGDACAVPNPRLVRLNKIMLWTATAFVVTFAAFPNYIGYVIGGGEAPVVEAADIPEAPRAPAAALVTHTYLVEGMSCAGCTVHIEETVAKVAGVQTVAVSYEDKLARVTFAPGAEIDEQLVIAAFDEAGFPAKRQGGQ